jgi:hypothetical protein
MYHNHWELDVLARHRIAEIVDESQRQTLVKQAKGRENTLLTQLCHDLGMALIQLGQALAGQEARRTRHSPPARPAIWGQPSF